MTARPSLLAQLFRLPEHGLRGLVWLYQRTLSPVLPAVFGSACACRFSPTCSHYATEALRTHGAIRGLYLAGRRLVKCTPLHPGGFDPVPAQRAQPRCAAVSPAALGRTEHVR